MNDWGWPQIVVAMLAIFGIVWQSVTWIKNPKLSSERVSVYIVMLILYYIGYVFTLHVGGFW